MIDLLPLLFISICFLLAYLHYQSIIFIIFIIIILVIIKKKKISNLFIFILVLIFFVFLYNFNITKPDIIDKQFKIVKINKSSYYAKNNQGTILLKTKVKLNKNNIVLLKCELKEISSYNNFRLFNYQDYLLSNKIHYECFENNPKILNKSINHINNNNDNKIYAYFDYLFFMDKSGISDDLINSLIELSIIHLVVVSGLHFNFLYRLLDFLSFFIKKEPIKKTFILLLLFLYLYKLDFSYPSLRAFLMILLLNISIFKKYGQLNILSIIGIAILLYNPLALLNMSFILTFYISFIIIILNKNIKKNKIIFSILIYYSIIPLIASMNYEVSIFGMFTSLLFTPFIFILFIFIFLARFIFFFQPFTLYIIENFENIIIKINEYNILINTGSFSWTFIILYLIVFLFVIHNYQKSKLLLTLPINIIIIYSVFPSIFGFVAFLDVGQGDCIVIKPFFSNEAIMIDVAKPYKSNTTNNVIIPFLKAHKIKKITKLIITHDDIDHSGGKDDLVKNFRVDKVIENKQKYIKFKNLLFVDLLYNKNFKDKNSNSITLYSRINGLNYFFSGDINTSTELEFYSVVKKMPVDILKVAHHGSKTSTSDKFLDLINPKIAIAQVKKNNAYKHPHDEVVERFKTRNISFYTTANNGSIIVYFLPTFNYIQMYKK